MFWDNFVSLCTRRGTSPNAVAAELKKSSGSVTAWKNGAVPRETTLKKIADYFEISIDELLYDQKEKSPTVGTGEAKVYVDDIIDKMSRAELLDLIQKATSKLKEQNG